MWEYQCCFIDWLWHDFRVEILNCLQKMFGLEAEAAEGSEAASPLGAAHKEGEKPSGK